MIKVGVIGYGYWGPNLARNFNTSDKFFLTYICDLDPTQLRKATKLYPYIKVTKDYGELIRSSSVDVVAIATPVNTHYKIAKDALLEGKDVFVEKPFTRTSDEAKELIDLANHRNKIIMVDHTFLFTPAIKKIKETLSAGTLGSLLYYDSTRINLGMFHHDVNVVWDLAPHDFYILNYLFSKPMAVSVVGSRHLSEVEEMANISVIYHDSFVAHININWLSPVKVRQILIGGREKMLMWNDLEADEKLKLYDRTLIIPSREGINEMLVSYRMGDTLVPKLSNKEALSEEIEHFANCLNIGLVTMNSGEHGLEVVKMLEACDLSISEMGRPFTL